VAWKEFPVPPLIILFAGRCRELKRILCLSIIAAAILAMSGASYGLDAPGHIIYEKDGAIFIMQPDGRGVKKLAEAGRGPVLSSPDGKKTAYYLHNSLYVVENGGQGRMVYQGKPDEKIHLFAWKPGELGIFFRKLEPGGGQHFFRMDEEKGIIKDLGVHHETPVLFETGEYWVHSSFKPGVKNSEVYGGPPGEKGNYIFHGKLANVIGWDRKSPVLLYYANDKIFGYELLNRIRQTFNLPFSDISVVHFGMSCILYYYPDYEEKSAGLKIYDPERSERTDIIEEKKVFVPVTTNQDNMKLVVFVPQKPKDIMGEGELYLVEIKEAKATKLTKERGYRVFREINMDNQWSPDGKYFVYDKVSMKFSSVKKSEIFIAGEGKDEKLIKQAGHPIWCDAR
jgi:hypothetical protein